MNGWAEFHGKHTCFELTARKVLSPHLCVKHTTQQSQKNHTLGLPLLPNQRKTSHMTTEWIDRPC